MTVGQTYSPSSVSNPIFLTSPCLQKQSPASRSFGVQNSSHSPRRDLMDFPRITPNLLTGSISYLKSLFFQRYIAARYDKDFSLEAFTQGAKGAMLAVSEILASDDISSLKDDGLVDPVAFREIKANHDAMDPESRRQLRVVENNVRQSHIHEVGIIEDDDTNQKAVEIMIIFFVLEMEASQKESPPPSFSEMMEKVVICNYRFFRDYTDKNNPTPWIINVINHFRPVDENKR